MRIVICDDQALIRDGLTMLLSLERDMQIVGVARDGAEAIEVTTRAQPDLVLMDLQMPGTNGVEATRQLRTRYPSIKILILTTYDDDEWVFDAIRAGAAGYLLKDSPREALIQAVRGTANGQTHIDPAVAGKLLTQVATAPQRPSSALTDKLTAREIEVLHLMARGCTNTDIAERLHLSDGTVRNHVSTILAKLAVADRTQAAVLAIRHGLG